MQGEPSLARSLPRSSQAEVLDLPQERRRDPDLQLAASPQQSPHILLRPGIQEAIVSHLEDGKNDLLAGLVAELDTRVKDVGHVLRRSPTPS